MNLANMHLSPAGDGEIGGAQPEQQVVSAREFIAGLADSIKCPPKTGVPRHPEHQNVLDGKIAAQMSMVATFVDADVSLSRPMQQQVEAFFERLASRIASVAQATQLEQINSGWITNGKADSPVFGPKLDKAASAQGDLLVDQTAMSFVTMLNSMAKSKA